MKCVISSTYDDKYLYFLPIVCFCWQKLNVDVICFMPEWDDELCQENFSEYEKSAFVRTEFIKNKGVIKYFNCPKNKEATYAQCSRLYGACLDLPEDEQLIISDIDMGFFSKNYIQDAVPNIIDIYGADLVPDGQFPMCYLSGLVKTWREVVGAGSYQEHLDNLLGDIECENMRGNYWSKDQQTIWEILTKSSNDSPDIDFIKHKRAKPGTQFADNRVDRDDTNWRSYVNDDLIDAHLWRPGYTEENFPKILELLQMKYPNDNFDWLIEYTNVYKQLL